MMKRMHQIEQKLDEVARQRRKEQTDTVVSTLISSITKKKQIVSQKIKRGSGEQRYGGRWRGTW